MSTATEEDAAEKTETPSKNSELFSMETLGAGPKPGTVEAWREARRKQKEKAEKAIANSGECLSCSG